MSLIFRWSSIHPAWGGLFLHWLLNVPWKWGGVQIELCSSFPSSLLHLFLTPPVINDLLALAILEVHGCSSNIVQFVVVHGAVLYVRGLKERLSEVHVESQKNALLFVPHPFILLRSGFHFLDGCFPFDLVSRFLHSFILEWRFIF